MLKKYFLLFLFSFGVSRAQDDLLNEINADSSAHKSYPASFKSLKTINLESTKLASKGDFYFVVAHRFGYVKNGFDDFFGLDNANTRLQFLYGLTNKITVQASRSGFLKTYDLGVKYNLLTKKGWDIVGFNSVAVNSELEKDLLPKLEFTDRLSYVTQVLISKQFGESLTFQIAPTFVHENYVYYNNQENSQLATGLGGRFKLSKRVTLNSDYVIHLNRANNSPYKNPLSMGVDIDTGGHIFQLHFTNSLGMHENGFVSNTQGDWSKGGFSFGFNLVRVF